MSEGLTVAAEGAGRAGFQKVHPKSVDVRLEAPKTAALGHAAAAVAAGWVKSPRASKIDALEVHLAAAAADWESSPGAPKTDALGLAAAAAAAVVAPDAAPDAAGAGQVVLQGAPRTAARGSVVVG